MRVLSNQTFDHRLPLNDTSVAPEKRSFVALLGCDYNALGPLDLKNQPGWESIEAYHRPDALYSGGQSMPLPVQALYKAGYVHPGMPHSSPLISTFADIRYTRRGDSLDIDINLGDATQVAIILPASVTAWSFDHPVPSPRADCNCHFIIFIHAGVDDQILQPSNPALYAPMRSNRKWHINVTNATRVEPHAFYYDKQRVTEHWDFVDGEVNRKDSERDAFFDFLRLPWITSVDMHAQMLPVFVE